MLRVVSVFILVVGLLFSGIVQANIVDDTTISGNKPALTLIPSNGSKPINLEWTTGHIIREILYQFLQFIDWRQTLYIVDHPDDFYELSPIIGPHPTKGTVNTFMVSGSLVHIGLSHYSPVIMRAIGAPDDIDYRKWFQDISITIKLANDARNAAIGVKIKW